MERLAWCLLCTAFLISPITMTGESSLVLLLFDVFCLSVCALAIPSKPLVVGKNFISSSLMPFLLIGIYLVFQITPISPALLKLLTPDTWQTYQETIWRVEPDFWMPISTHVEGTLYALFHVSALCSLGLVFGFLVNSHLRLIRFIQFVALSVTLWLVLIILMSLSGQFSIFEWVGSDALKEKLLLVLGQWSVAFFSLIIASWVAFRNHDHHVSLIRRAQKLIKAPSQTTFFVFASNLFLMIICLLLIRAPFLWLVALTGYLLFRLFKSGYRESQRSIFIIRFSACACVVGMIIWVAFFPTLNNSSTVNYDNSLGFSWFGHGLGAPADNGTIVWMPKLSNGDILMRGGGEEIWAGMGVLGTIFIVTILCLFTGRIITKSINSTDKITSNLSSGSIAGLVVLVMAGSFNSMWQWQPLTTCVLYLVLIMVWIHRLSCWHPGEGYHEISKGKIYGLRGCTCLILIVAVFFVSLKTIPRAIYDIEDPLQYTSNELSGEYSIEWWQKKISMINPYDGHLSLSIGQKFLIQERDQEAQIEILKALRLQPLSPQTHVAMAILSACGGDETNSTHFFSTQAAGRYTPDDMTKFLVARLLEISDSDAAVRLINLALRHAPLDASLYMNLMMLHGYDPLSLDAIISNHPMVMLALGNLLLSEGYKEEAENAYLTAVYNKDADELRNERLYFRIAKYFWDNNRTNEAIIVVREGLNMYPESSLLMEMAAFYGSERGFDIQ